MSTGLISVINISIKKIKEVDEHCIKKRFLNYESTYEFEIREVLRKWS